LAGESIVDNVQLELIIYVDNAALRAGWRCRVDDHYIAGIGYQLGADGEVGLRVDAYGGPGSA
jgi:hypothetical protein